MLAPDVLILNGDIRTMDPALPRAEALAISGNRIVAIGATDDLERLAGPRTWLVDAARKTVLPGFNDAHVHFLTGGFSLSSVNLRDARSPEGFTSRLSDYAASVAPGTWIVGGDWDHVSWRAGAEMLPSKALIDSFTARHPVLVNRLDGHMSLANSLALRLAGITCSTPDPPGGIIVRDQKTGEPTGLLKDAAEQLVRRVIPEKTFHQKLSAARAASEFAVKRGVTSVTDMSAGSDIGVYQRLLQCDDLKTRIYAARSIADWEPLGRAGIGAGFGSDMLRIGALKGFADGSLGSGTALFFEAYLDLQDNRGLLFEQMLPEGRMLERVVAADQCGLQVMIHAIGDEANLRILDLFAAVAEKNVARDRRFRIEHAQHLRPTEVCRFGAQGVIASMQPYHAADDGRWCERRLGSQRARQAYVFRSLLDTGATLAFGSDWTVAPLDPLPGIKAAVTRQTLDGAHPQGWFPEQKITLDEAIWAYTAGSAYAEFAETRKGTLSPGKLADVVLLDRNIFELDPSALDQAEVVLTILDGRVVFDRL
jgi:predicted amidohydrolase YtcJ